MKISSALTSSMILCIICLMNTSTLSAGAAVQEDTSYLYSKAVILKNDGKYKEALDILLDLEKNTGGSDRIFNQTASCYYSSSDYRKAIEYAGKAISKNPKYVEPYQLKFDIYLNLKNFDDAAETLVDLTAERPDLIQYHYTLGILYSQNMENYKLAADSFKTILSLSKTIPVPSFYKEQACLILSDIYYAQKDYKKSVEYLTEAVKLNSRNNSKYYRYSTAFLSGGYYDSARLSMELFLSNLQENQKANPLVKNLYSYLANIYYISDDPKTMHFLRIGRSKDTIEGTITHELFNYETAGSPESIAALEKISTSEYSSHITPFIALAESFSKRNDKDKAYQSYISAGSLLAKTDMLSSAAYYFLQAHKIKPDEKEAYGYLAQVYEQMGNKRLAALYFSRYLTFTVDPEVSLHLAFLYEVTGEKSKSDKVMENMFKDNENNPRFHFIKGIILSRRDKFTEAENSLRRAVELRSDDPTFYYYLATVQEKNSKINEAETSLLKALEFDKQNASYKNFLGYLYADANIKLDQAGKLVDEALKQEPYNGAYLDSLGWVYYKQGKTDLAIKKLKIAARVLDASGDSDPVVYDHLGDVYVKTGQTDKALQSWKKSLSIKKDDKVEKKIRAIEKK